MLMSYLFSKYNPFVNEVVGFSTKLCSQDSQAEDVFEYFFKSTGKNLRIILFSILNKSKDSDLSKKLASIIFLIHQATLLHDDVIDQSDKRRGETTVNAEWSNRISILSGDFMLSKVLNLVVDVNSMEILKPVNEVINRLVKSELKHAKCDEFLKESEYLEIMEDKTASLFELSVMFASFSSKYNSDFYSDFLKFSKHIGIAFQISDDLLDYDNSQSLGKNYADDFNESKQTYPSVVAFNKGIEKDFFAKVFLDKKLENGDLDRAVSIFKNNGIFKLCFEKVVFHCKKAIEFVYKYDDVFEDLSSFAAFPVNRLDKSKLFDFDSDDQEKVENFS